MSEVHVEYPTSRPEHFYVCESVEEANVTGQPSCQVSLCVTVDVVMRGAVLLQFGGQLFEDVDTTAVNCSVLEGVECAGDHNFIKTDVPCVRLVVWHAMY